MSAPTRRAFLQNAVAAAAVGAIGARLIEVADAMPVASDLGQVAKQSDLVVEAQWWGPQPGPGWGWGSAPGWGRPSPVGRRWVCWWHRGRRHCGWRTDVVRAPPAPGWGSPGWGGTPGWGASPGWGWGPAPGWGRPTPVRRRRWVCWWHRGRRLCGWR
ncbi:twin-arginine translocation signal domain-containing protein [Bradyrhizobium liaoningense]|uniref:twin-arginine translocation signal domain-containing protein n=1 Tax=Bradyrhizobium liaoningense TaxID=43992 RepID=UPI001BA474BF|nr:twin-arginine translocation signal domain-containing protein [Bradyrhizobium liaoningense]MBR0854051.1 twin-arginine translocation signal domain-containing protein [Bradyrhizobium liaoningense]